jgi:hypothetical protein
MITRVTKTYEECKSYDDSDGHIHFDGCINWTKNGNIPATRLSQPLSALISQFLVAFIDHAKPTNIYRHSAGDFGIFNSIKEDEKSQGIIELIKFPKNVSDEKKKNYLLLADFPEETIKPSYEKEVLPVLELINESGSAIIAIDQSKLGYGTGFSIYNLLEEQQLYCSAIFFVIPTKEKPLCSEYNERLAESLGNWVYHSGIYLLIVEKKISSQQFVAEINENFDQNELIKNFLDRRSGICFQEGILLPAGSFKGMDDWNKQSELNKLLVTYKNQQSRSLSELIVSTHLLNEADGRNALDLSNAIIIDNRGVVSGSIDLSKFSFQLVIQLNKNLALKDYLLAFFNGSQVGRKIISYSPKQSDELFLGKLNEACIPLPGIETQNRIVAGIEKLKNIREKFAGITSDILFDEAYSSDAIEKINNLADLFNALSDSEKIITLIERGESKKVEFKETVCLDVKKGTKQSYIELGILKTICAFLNSDGGTLLVGVTDNKVLLGLDREIELFFHDHDGLLLHIRNLIHNRLGAKFYSHISQRICEINRKSFLIIECSPAKFEAYVDDKDFYVRTNPATDKLEGPQLVQYVRTRFSQGYN